MDTTSMTRRTALERGAKGALAFLTVSITARALGLPAMAQVPQKFVIGSQPINLVICSYIGVVDFFNEEGLNAEITRFQSGPAINQAIAAGNVSEWGQLNAEFHMALYVRARQPRTQTIVAALLQTSDRYTRMQLSNTTAMGIAEREHAELIALCGDRKVDDACRFLEKHIEAVRTDLLGVIGRTMSKSGKPA